MTNNNADKITNQAIPNNIGLAGDVNGRNNNSTVVAIQNNAVSSAVPGNNELTWITSGNNWQPSNAILEVAIVNITNISAGSNYTLIDNDMLIVIGAGGGTTNIYLPPNGATGRTICIRQVGSATTITAHGNIRDYSDVYTSYTSGGVIWLYFDGTDWAKLVAFSGWPYT